MASSYNRKSSSSASNAQKPTFRKPAKKGKPQATRRSSAAGGSSLTRAASSPKPARKGAPVSRRQPSAPSPRSAQLRSGAAPAAGSNGRARKASAKPSLRAPRQQAPRQGAAQARVAATRQVPRASGAGVTFPAPGTSRRSSRKVPAPRTAGASGAPRFKLPSLPLPALHLPRRLGVVLAGAAGAVALAFVAFLVVANTSVFAVTEIELVATDRVSQESMASLVKVPEGATLLNVDENAIADQLKKDSWVKGVEVKRVFPHKLVITPVEHKAGAIVYISTADVAWAVSDEGTWIAPVALGQVEEASEGEGDAPADDAGGEQDAQDGSADDGTADDAEGSDGSDSASDSGDGAAEGEDAPGTDGASDSEGDSSDADGSDAGSDGDADGTADGASGSSDAGAANDAESAQAGYDAALGVADEMGALLIADVGTDVEPKSGEKVDAAGVSAAIDYATGFTGEFRSQIKSFSAPSAESLSLYTTSGVEVSLGVAEDIPYKQTVIERILSENPTVTYVNVRTPESPTWRTVAS